MPDRPVFLCDVMDTLVYDPFNREIPAFFGMTQAELLAQKHPSSWVEFERDEIDEAQYFRRYFADGRSFDYDGFRRVVRQAYHWIDGAEELLSRLCQRGFEINALSNYPSWYRTIESKLRLSRYLHWRFVSCQTGIRKPDPEAYLGAAKVLRRAPHACLFIDDRLVNCHAAEAVGMPALHFRDATTLWSELRDRGLIT